MSKKCPVCQEKYIEMRKLTAGKHKHYTNILNQENGGNAYCVQYQGIIDTGSVKGYAKIFTHRKDFTGGVNL